MRLVSIKELNGSEIAGCDITDMQGRLMLSKGSRIKLSYLNKLDELGVSAVYIEDGISEGIKAEGILCDETKFLAKNVIEKEMKRYLKKKEIIAAEIHKVTHVIVNEILMNRIELINLKDIKLKGEYIFSHCVNVCALSVFLCNKMGMDHNRIQTVGAGALLHDFGKILLPSDLLYKSDNLTPEEIQEINMHPVNGYDALKDDVSINPTTKVTVLMHHEHVDGSGYPHGLQGNKIHVSAKICSICNTFDAMTSDYSPNASNSTSDAVEYLYTTAGMYFEKDYVTEFLKYVPIYPPGTIVLLSSGHVAIVVKNNSISLTRPLVRLLYNPKSRVKYKNIEIDLMQDLTLKIEKEIRFNQKEYELMK